VINRIEVELSRHLKPLAAPDDLWRKVQTAPVACVRKPRWLLWSVAAAVTAASALFYFSVESDSTSYLAKAAWRELSSGTEPLDFRSSDPLKIRAWIEANAGLDIPLVSTYSVQFIGVTLLRTSPCIVSVSYRIGNRRGELLVARGGSGGPKHPSIRQTSFKGATVTSWAAAGQTYAIATMESPHSACILCHVDRKGSLMPPPAG
jgi:hypothetical protein